MRNLILRSFQSPGDILMLTAAVRDLHAAYPGQFATDVRTAADALWLNNPHLTKLRDADGEILDMHYPLVHQSNQRPYHFLHGYVQYLEEKLGLKIPVTRFHGDIHLAAEEKRVPEFATAAGLCDGFWIIVAGGKYDFTAKWWDPDGYQQVVDRFRDKIQFVQCGEEGHWHPRLKGVVDLVGKTSPREFVRLMHHADGVVCPVTFAMHLAAAVETKLGKPKGRPCVVIAGGREPPHWEAYPQHQFLSTVGALPCCAEGGCWRSRCQLVGDGDQKDRHDVCERPIQLRSDLRIPECMHMIKPDDVIRRIEMYFEGGMLEYDVSRLLVSAEREAQSAERKGHAVAALNPLTNGAPALRAPAHYYEKRKQAGLDYLAFGDWQRQYGRWLVESLGLGGKRILDVGCACGAIARGLQEGGAVVQGMDINEYMIGLGREKWPDLPLFICDAVNLHLFEDATFDAIHAAQVAGEWKPALVPHVLAELARVTVPGGLLFFCQDLNSERSALGAPALHEKGWEICTEECSPALHGHRDNFLKRYAWAWFVARKTTDSTDITNVSQEIERISDPCHA